MNKPLRTPDNNGVVECRIKKAGAKLGVCWVMESKENKNF